VQNEEFYQPDYNAPLAKELAELPLEAAPPTPNRPPWNIFMALGVWMMSIAFIVIFPSLFLLPYVIQKGIEFTDMKVFAEFAMTDPTAIFLQLLSVLPAHIFTLLLAWLVVTYYKKYSFRQTLGWSWGGFKWWHAFVITFLFYGIIFLFVTVLGKQENEFDKMVQSSRAAIYLVAFFATFTAPLVEEVIYRGILFSALQNPKKIVFPQVTFLRRFQEFYARHSTVFAVLIVTFLFAIIHIPQYSSGSTPDYATIAPLLMLSLVLTLIRVKTQNLLPCIVLHTVFNGLQALLMVIQPFLEQQVPKIEETPALLIHLLK
jgi:uncharacterized protein